MTLPPEFQVTPRPGSDKAANNAAAAVALGNALLFAIDRLEKLHGGVGPWLDELEASSIRWATSTAFMGIDLGVEADAVQFGADTVQSAFARARDRIEKRG